MWSKTALISCCFLLLFYGCKKGRIERHYTGNFVFTNHYTFSDINGNHLDTTIVSHGQITIFSGQAASEASSKRPVFLNIRYGNGTTVVEVNKNGSFVTDHMLHGEISGSFSDDDHLHFMDENGGLGSHYSNNVTGVRE